MAANIETNFAACIEKLPTAKDEYRLHEERVEAARRRSLLSSLHSQVGARYQSVTLDGFKVYGSADVQKRMQKAIKLATAFSVNMPEWREKNLLFFGTVGTGKDHLMIALAREIVLGHGIEVLYTTGGRLFRQLRSAISRRESESDAFTRFVKAPILAISDPVPAIGGNSDYSASQLQEIVDERYRMRLGTWITANVEGRQDGMEGFGVAVYDRLMQDAVTIDCNWPSYRTKS